MIPYELLILFRVMPKPELKDALKRVANHIFTTGGIIRKLENLGTRATPYKISMHDTVHRKASYFLLEFNAPPTSIENLLDEYIRDVDIVRRRIYKKTLPEKFECTLDDELKAAPYRKDVQELIEEAKKLKKPKFSHNSGLNYYPFQK